MKVLLIAGHGAGDSGAVGNGYKEADLTRKIVAALEPKLKKYCSVGVYPTSRNAYADVQNGTFADYVPGGIKSYNYVFEVHLNSAANDPDGNGVTTGTEIYITSAEEGYTVETAILKNVCSMGFRNRGVKRTDFSVIATCKNYGVSSALLESCFIDDQDDVDLLVPNIDEFAQKVVDGIAGGFELKASSGSKPSAGTGSSSSSKKTVSQLADEVIAGKWGNGTARKEALESAGYDYAAVQAEVDRRYGVTSTTTKCDDILTVGSVVTSKPMAIKAVDGSAIKYIDGVECVNIPDLGGWFPTKYVSEYDASDGKKDNYLANTKAKVYLDNATVEAIDIPNNLAKIHGIWCKADPMIEIKEGK